MDKNKTKKSKSSGTDKVDFFDHLWEKSWTYIKTVVDVLREQVLILDANLNVMAANESFYETFQVTRKNTENQNIYKLGNGQWNIPELRKLLDDILPKHTFFKGFQVAHEFPNIGRKVMILNARQIHIEETNFSTESKSFLLLAMEDVTDMMRVAETLSNHAKEIESRLITRTQKLELHIGRLEKELGNLKQMS